jgi:valyl-tRNA synthetase
MKIDAFCLTATPGCNVTAGTDGSTSICDNSTTAINLFSIITGEQTGGTWSRVTGTGGTFVAATGTFTPATAATTSTFRYVVTGTAPCSNDTSIATVTINPQANAGSDGTTTVCDTLITAVNLYNVITGEQTGGTWSRITGTGGTFNAAAGTFLPAVGATNSTFRYVKTGTAPCPNDTSIATVNIQSCQLLTLGNRVWYDANNNGLNDASENGIRNVSVKLYADANNDNVADGASIASATTDVNGNYSFSNLSPGNYIVGVIIPNGYMSSNVNGGDPDNNTDLDDNGQVLSGNEIRGLAITLASGTEPTSGSTNNTYDFGLLPDCNCTTSASNLLVNGSFENGTTGWSWSAANGSLTTGTGYIACGAANGFNNQISGTSKVWQDVAVAAGSTVTFKAFAGTHTAGIACSPTLSLIFLNAANTVLGQSNVTVTRDVDINNNQLEQYSITAVAPAGTTKARVQSSITCNTMKMDAFCLNITAAPLGSIGDRVWEDTNRDGVQDAGELGLAGITVRLYDNTTNTVLATAITNATGNYLFSNLTTGAAGTNYQVGFTLPSAQFMFSPNNGAVTDPSNSDANTTTGRSGTITLTNATPNATYADAGIYRLINISGNVWNDANGLTDLQINKTGTQAIPNSLNIYLVDVATNQIVQSESINFDGTYNFFNVDINHSYKIVLSTIVAFPGENSPIPFLPSGWQRVGENLGAGPLSGSDGVPNGLLFLDTETSDVIDANFGIRVSSGEVIVG